MRVVHGCSRDDKGVQDQILVHVDVPVQLLGWLVDDPKLETDQTLDGEKHGKNLSSTRRKSHASGAGNEERVVKELCSSRRLLLPEVTLLRTINLYPLVVMPQVQGTVRQKERAKHTAERVV